MERVFKVGFINSTKQLLDCALSAAAKLNINMATALAGLDAGRSRRAQDGAGGGRGDHQPSRNRLAPEKEFKDPILSVRISFPDIFLMSLAEKHDRNSGQTRAL